MSWESYLSLLESVGGKAECLLPERVAQATADGDGDPATQMRIAEIVYRSSQTRQTGRTGQTKQLNRKEADDGQNRWHFA